MKNLLRIPSLLQGLLKPKSDKPKIESYGQGSRFIVRVWKTFLLWQVQDVEYSENF
jgi:hypothetical protein